MEFATVLTNLIVVLLAAKVAAEVAERVGVPAVVGEIVAGVIVGPSMLGWIGHGNEIIVVLGELGVILLLLEVGMEMDLAELSKVGKASFLVAVVGVVSPMVLGFFVMQQFIGADFNTSLFVGAALTATSVGITARVFGDLKALATTEARVVLGAAVADDVMGLVVLTVVVRLVTEGSVSALSVLGIIGVAVLFLAVGTVVGLRIADPLFNLVSKTSKSSGTMVAVAFAFAMGFARIAAAAKLAPIVGAFVGGLALTRSRHADHIRRELAPVGHILIPVFFLHIGVEADIKAFASLDVLRDAALLLIVAAIGKLLSPIGAAGTKTDKMLIGLGMLPRGEVGLIFATLGKQAGVLDDDLYAALLLVVLVTTLVTPQLLKLRYSRLDPVGATIDEEGEPQPAGGWLVVHDAEVELAARPPIVSATPIALDAALRVAFGEPGAELSSWLAAVPEAAKRWRPEYYDRLLDVAERGNARSWRFLDVTGVLDGISPALHAGFERRRDDSRTMDPLTRYRLAGLEGLRRLDGDDPVAIEAQQLLYPDRLVLALLAMDAFDAVADPVGQTADFVGEIGLVPEDAAGVVALVGDRELLWAASLRAGALAEENVLSVASHLETPEHARALFVSTMLTNHGAERWQLGRVRELYRLVQESLTRDSSMGASARDVIAEHKAQAISMAADQSVEQRIASAPRSYLLRHSPDAIARHAEFLRRPFQSVEVRVRSHEVAPGEWTLEVATRDRPALLSDVTAVLSANGLTVDEAVVATWPDGVALETFRVRGSAPDTAAIERDIRTQFALPLTSEPLEGIVVTFDSSASPWHTVVDLQADDRPGLLHTVAAAFAAAGVEVVAATVSLTNGRADDRFEVVDKSGHKISAEKEAAVREFLAGGVATTRRWFRDRHVVAVSGG